MDHDVKLDGYRALIIKSRRHVEVRSRNDKNLASMYPSVAQAGIRVNAQRAIIDGEIVALDENGRPPFQALQHRGPPRNGALVFYAFDLLHANGENRTDVALEERRRKLRPIISESGLLLSEALPGAAAEIVAAVRDLGLKGSLRNAELRITNPASAPVIGSSSN